MTKDQLDDIRAVIAECRRLGWATRVVDDCDDLLKEVERLNTQSAADLGRSQVLGWEIDELRGKRCITGNEFAEYDTFCGECIHCAYKRGAEAMREAAAIRIDGEGINGVIGPYFGNIIRAIPIPEEK